MTFIGINESPELSGKSGGTAQKGPDAQAIVRRFLYI